MVMFILSDESVDRIEHAGIIAEFQLITVSMVRQQHQQSPEGMDPDVPLLIIRQDSA